MPDDRSHRRSTLDRRAFLKLSGAAAGAALTARLLPGLLAEDSAAARPNVLFIHADQWRYSVAAGQSESYFRMPAFEQFAAQGVRFSRMYATYPLCTPNRSCLLSGRYPHQTGMMANDLMLPPGNTCLADVFAAAGYATHYIGKWHIDGPARPGFVPSGWRRRGFQAFEGFNRGHFYFKPRAFTDRGAPLNPDAYEPTFQTDLAVDFLRRHKDRPFFCFLSWGPPHEGFNPIPDSFRARYPHAAGDIRWRPNVPDAGRNEARVRQRFIDYWQYCESLDVELKRLLAALDQLDLARRTLVVFTADHGDMLGSHGLMNKSQAYEESLRIPLILRLGGCVPVGATCDRLVSTVDLMPTILSLCAVKVPASCAGRNLAGGGALELASPAGESVYAECVNAAGPWRAVVTGTHKLFLGPAGEVTNLFDLEHDPFEMKDLAAEASAEGERKRLVALARDWAAKTGDPFPGRVTLAKSSYPDP